MTYRIQIRGTLKIRKTIMRDIIQGTADEATVEEVTEVIEVTEMAVITGISQITNIDSNQIIIKDIINQITENIINY